MNSNNIIPKLDNKKINNKEINKSHYDILKEYFNYNNNDNIIPKLENNIIIKIEYIIKYYKKENIIKKLIKSLNFVYQRFINQFLYIINNNEDFKFNDKEIEYRLLELKNKHLEKEYIIKIDDNIETHNYKMNKIKSIINYQYNFIFYFKKFILELINKNKTFIFNNYNNINKNKIKKDEEIKKFTNDYFKRYINVKLISEKHKKQKFEDLTDDKKKIYIFLKKISENIILKSQIYLNNNDKKEFYIYTYGSYTCNILDNSINYNDIDIYHTNPLHFLTSIMLLFNLILNIDVKIFKIPFILGHLSLIYENVHFLDCIYMDKFTIEKIDHIIINDITFVHPLLQIINNFRMMSEIRRMDSVSLNFQNIVKKNELFLNFINNILNIDYNKDLKKLNIDIKLIDNFILLDLKKIYLSFMDEYKEINNKITLFDYLIISTYSVKNFLKILKSRDDMIISKQYFALFNEIIIEFRNKEKKNNNNNNNDNINVLKKNIKNIHYSKIKNLINNDNNDDINLNKFDEYINFNNVLLFSNFSTDLYFKNFISEEKMVNKDLKKITNISIETIILSFVLYNIIKNKDQNDIKKFFFKIALSIIKFNDIEEELNILAKNPSKCNEFNDIIYNPKIKLQGRHQTFSYKDTIFKNIFFYNSQNEDYYIDKEKFLQLTYFNSIL